MQPRIVLCFWQVVSGECGVLSAIKPGKSFVDMSLVEVDTDVDRRAFYFPTKLHPKQDVDPSSRFCTSQGVTITVTDDRIITRNSLYLVCNYPNTNDARC